MIVILLLALTDCSQTSHHTALETLRIKCLKRSFSQLCHDSNQCTDSFHDMHSLCQNYHVKRMSHTLSSPSIFLTTSQHSPTSTDYNYATIALGTLPPSLVDSIKEVQVAPVISTYPHNTSINTGSYINLQCEADDDAVITIVKYDDWVRDDEIGLLEGSEGSGVGKVSRKIAKVVVEDGGWYKCIAANLVGVSYVEFYITVLNLCEDMQCKSPKRCVVNSVNNTVGCECPNYCRKNKKKNKYSVVCGNDCVNYFTLCHLKNAECVLGAVIGIFMKGYCPPTHYPKVNLVKEYVGTLGEDVVLRCEVVSQHQFSMKWYRVNSTEILANKSTLVIPKAVKSDEGEYICKATLCTSTVGAVTNLYLLTYKPPNICKSVGGSHIRTFDNFYYNFNGYGDYVLAMDCNQNSWHVYGRFKPCGKNVSCLFSMTVYYKRKGLSLYRQFHVLAKELWHKLQPGDVFLRDEMNITFDGSVVKIELGDSGVKVVWDGMMAGAVFIPADHGATCGMCGNHDGAQSNDIAPRPKKKQAKYSEKTSSLHGFVTSWMIGKWGDVQEEGTSTNLLTCPEDSSNEERNTGIHNMCETVLSKLTNNSKCIVDIQYYIKVCVHDSCQMKLSWSSTDSACYVASVIGIECAMKPMPVIIEQSEECREALNFNNKINVYA